MTKVHIFTQGCSANMADSEVMAGALEKDYLIVDNVNDADVVVFNTCTVKGPSESAFLRKLKQVEASGKKVVIAGCIPQSSERKRFESYSQIGTDQLTQIPIAVSHAVKGEAVSFLQHSDKPRLNVPKVRRNKFVEIVPISQGCLSACTYCKTKHARGALVSTPVVDIVRHISKAVEEGVKEIWLTSQDISAYGFDNGTNIARLLKAICSIPRDFKMRVGMGNPLFVTEFIDEYVEAFASDKIYKFLHLPVQCGSDAVLDDMKRGYTVEDFKLVVSKFREAYPQLCLTTDIICGFPSESFQQFEETVSLVKEVKPDSINISRFWPREGTPAAKMKQIDGPEVKRRSKQMTTLYQETSLSNNKKWIGWKGDVLIVEKAKFGGFIGRNFAYKQVIVPSSDNLLGKTVEVKIVDATTFDLRCEEN